jgi:hypothetical protein
VSYAASILWSLATTSKCRESLLKFGVVERLLETLGILNEVDKSAHKYGHKHCVEMRESLIGCLSVSS